MRQLNLRLSDEVHDLVAELAREISAQSGAVISKSDIVRIALQNLARVYGMLPHPATATEPPPNPFMPAR